jgi:hypothetical protein
MSGQKEYKDQSTKLVNMLFTTYADLGGRRMFRGFKKNASTGFSGVRKCRNKPTRIGDTCQARLNRVLEVGLILSVGLTLAQHHFVVLR